MAGTVRKGIKAKSVIGWSLLVIICGVFVFFGLPQQFGIPGAGSAATVNGELISLADLQSEEQRLNQVFANFMGGQSPTAQRQFLRQQALQNLVTLELVAQAAKDQGIQTSDSEVLDFLTKDIEAFQEEGHFQRERYKQYLQAIGASPREFESRLRKDRQNLRVRRLIETSVTPMDLELEKQAQLRNQRLNVEFVQLDSGELAKNVDVADQRVNTALEDEAFSKRVSEYYSLNKEEFSEPEQVKAQHILVRTEPGEQQEGIQAQPRDKIKKIQEELKTKDFAEVARENSDDPGSKEKGGDLGFFERGRMTPTFEDVAFSLEPGKVSDVVETEFGLHIIKVNEHKAATQKSLDEVKKQIAKNLIAEEEVDKRLAELQQAVVSGESTEIQNKIKSLGTQWQETGWFNLTADRIPKLGSSPEVLSSVFQLQKEGQMSSELIQDGGKRYILRLKGQEQQAAQAPAKDVLQEQIARDRSYAIYQSWVDAIREKAKVDINQAIVTGAGAQN